MVGAKLACALHFLVAPGLTVTLVVPRARTVDAFVVKLITIVYVVALVPELVTVPDDFHPLDVATHAPGVTSLRAAGSFLIAEVDGEDPLPELDDGDERPSRP